MKFSRMLAVADILVIRRRPHGPCASPPTIFLLSFISSRSISRGGTNFSSLSLMVCSLAIWPIERSVVPPILRTRSASSSVDAKICVGLLVEHQMIVAEMPAADMPMEVLGLKVKRECVGEQRVERRGNLVDRPPATDRSGYRVRARRHSWFCSRRLSC